LINGSIGSTIVAKHLHHEAAHAVAARIQANRRRIESA
jgi:hypothetical protein